jgi:hypothetical protein
MVELLNTPIILDVQFKIALKSAYRVARRVPCAL